MENQNPTNEQDDLPQKEVVGAGDSMLIRQITENGTSSSQKSSNSLTASLQKSEIIQELAQGTETHIPQERLTHFEALQRRMLRREAQKKAARAILNIDRRKKAAEAKRRQVQFAERKAKLKKTKPALFKKFVERHAKTLYFKRRALLTKDDYGKNNVHAWNEEVDRFINDVVPKSIRAKSIINHKRAKTIILDVVRKYALTAPKTTELPKDPFEFERLCAEILSKEGWKTTTTKKTGDQGVDVVAEKNGKSVVLQCKLYSQPVGNKAVQEAFSGMKFVGANAAIVVSNAGFTKSAKQLANSLGVHLIHHSGLIGLQSLLKSKI